MQSTWQGGLGAWVVACGLMWVASGAAAEERSQVLLTESAGVRPELCSALRIQLADVADVRCEAGADGDTLAARIASAVARVEQLHAKLGVFLERDPEGRDVRMYLVAARSDEAVLAVERIQDRPAPDVDRSLALKVRDTLDSARVAALLPQVDEASGLRASALRPALSERGARPGWSGFLEAGGGLRAPSPLHALSALGLGARYQRAGYALEAGVAAHWLSQHEARGRAGNVRSQEWSTGLSLRALWRGARVELGGLAEARALVASAQGVTQGGQRGDARKTLPVLALGLDLRVRLLRLAALRLAPALELLPIGQRFAVDGEVLYDVGRRHFVLPLTVLVQLPLGEAVP